MAESVVWPLVSVGLLSTKMLKTTRFFLPHQPAFFYFSPFPSFSLPAFFFFFFPFPQPSPSFLFLYLLEVVAKTPPFTVVFYFFNRSVFSIPVFSSAVHLLC